MEKPVALLDRGLRGRAEHDGRAVVVDELLEGGQGRREQRNRQGLGLVEDDHALRQAVQLSAPGGPAGEERLEELHVGRDDERRVEVLCREPCAVGLARRVVRLEAAVVLQKLVARDQPSASRKTSAVCSMMLVNGMA